MCRVAVYMALGSLLRLQPCCWLMLDCLAADMLPTATSVFSLPVPAHLCLSIHLPMCVPTPTTPRWEVYICTTAEREYAWEAWRLLDPEGSLFPLTELTWRMLCVTSPQKKDLLNVLRKRNIDAVLAAGHTARSPSDLQYITDKGE